MAEKIVNEIKDDFLTCKLCSKTFIEPKALSCLHTFCKSCLGRHVDRNAVRAGDGTSCVFCPACRQVCDIPAAGVAGLQDNHLLKSLLGTLHSHTKQGCDLCRDEGKKIEATYVCIRCEDFLCNDCSKSHKKTRLTRDHLVMKISSMRDMYNTSVHNKPNPHSATDVRVRQMARFGHYGENMCNPVSIAVNTANDIILSNDNNNIAVFSIAGECKQVIEQTPFYGLEKNCLSNRCSAVTSEGFIAVAMRKDRTSSTAHVGVIESLAKREVAVLTAKVSNTQDVTPHGICVMKNNHIAISDVGKHCIYIFDADYELFKQFGKRGSKKSQFKYPYHLATNRNNDILVSDYGNHAIKVFDYKGKFKFKFGSLGSELDQFIHPVGLCTDPDSNIFVCDKDNHRVLMFNNEGEFVCHVIGNSCRDSLDIRPQDVALTTQRHLVVLLKGIEGIMFSQVHIYQYSTSAAPGTLDEETTQQLYMLRASIDSMNMLTGPKRSSYRGSSLPPLHDSRHGAESTVPQPPYGSYRKVDRPGASAPMGQVDAARERSTKPDVLPKDFENSRENSGENSGARNINNNSKQSNVCVIL